MNIIQKLNQVKKSTLYDDPVSDMKDNAVELLKRNNIQITEQKDDAVHFIHGGNLFELEFEKSDGTVNVELEQMHIDEEFNDFFELQNRLESILFQVIDMIKIDDMETFLEDTTFPSVYDIGDEVVFFPMASHVEEYNICRKPKLGTIKAIRFTEAKVLHDIVDDYYGYMFENVDSAYLFDSYDEAQKAEDELFPTDCEQY